MVYMKIHHEKVTPENAADLVKICPFSAISYENEKLDIGAVNGMVFACMQIMKMVGFILLHTN